MLDNAAIIEQEEPVSSFIIMSMRQFLGVILIGLAAGLIVWLLQIVLTNYIFSPILCRDGQSSNCGSVENYSIIVASVIGASISLLALVRLNVYRPLLVVLASLISLWGMYALIYDKANSLWVISLILFVIIYACTYGLFAWLARIKSLIISVVLIALAVLIIRLTLM